MLDTKHKSSYVYGMSKLSVEKRVQILSMLVEGSSMRSTSRVTGASINTVSKLLIEAGKACLEFHDENVRGLKSERIQCDEIWSFCYAKQKNADKADMPEFAGDIWTWTSLDADSKLICNWFVGGRDAEYANFFMQDLAERLDNRVQLTTDGHKAYLQAVDGAFGNDIDYAQLVKLYGQSPNGKTTRYSPAECTGIKKNERTGSPDQKHVSTSYVERQNLNMRMGMRRFTRLTNAFSKKYENHCHALALYFVYYNFIRKHTTLKTTPAVAAGLVDEVYTMELIVDLVEKNAPKTGRPKKLKNT
jgi:IS1 family transposase